MIMSQQKKFIFIEVPKTGTSSVAECLLRLDKTLKRDVIYHKNKPPEKILSSHITLSEVFERLGSEAKNYTFIGFLRNPEELIVSKYFFYRGGRAYTRIVKGDFNFLRFMKVISAKLMPIWLWVILYPYKGNSHFVNKKNGELGLDIVGNFESLEVDFKNIFSRFGYDPDDLHLDKVNVTNYKKNRNGILSFFLKISLLIHARSDMELFKSLETSKKV